MRRPAEGKEIARSLHLAQEVDIAVGLLEQGLAAIQGDIGRVGAMDHLQMVLLSTGLERLLKCILAYHIRESQGRFPRGGEIRKTHDVESLLDEVLDRVFTDEHIQRPAALADQQFLKGDARFRSLVRAITQFAEPLGRYWNLNAATEGGPTTPSPQDAWKEVEADVMEDEGLSALLESLDEEDVEGENAVFEALSRALVATLERGFRGLCSLFVFGALGYEGTEASSFVKDFVLLRDEDLGTRRYAKRPSY